MEEDEFVAALVTVLEEYTDSTHEQILRLLTIIPDQATLLDFVVFPAQDGDGFFEVRASVSGPDLYVINKAIRAHADLFVAKHTETGIEPAIPIVDPFDTDYPVNDMVVDCVANWLQRIWQSFDNVSCRVPVFVVADDEYGTITPLQLHPS